MPFGTLCIEMSGKTEMTPGYMRLCQLLGIIWFSHASCKNYKLSKRWYVPDTHLIYSSSIHSYSLSKRGLVLIISTSRIFVNAQIQ